jgi:hypothetical protein
MVEKPKGKRSHERLRRRWEGNIKRDIKEIGWEGMYFTDVTQDGGKWRDVNTVMCL